jgi:hypothetical protein
MPGLPALLCALLVAVPDAGSSETAAAPPVVDTPAGCPDANVVWAGVTALVGAGRLPPVDARPPLQIDDLGTRYRVSIAGRSREVVDDTRDCGRRAQVAAVFVALTLVPPEVPEPETPPSPPPPTLTLLRPQRWPIRLEVAPWLGANVLGAQDRAAFAGGLVRVALGAARLAAVAGVGASFGAQQDGAPGRIREQRFSVDAGVRLRWRGERLEGDLDLEAAVAWLDVAPTSGASKMGTVDVGGRVGGILAVGQGRIVPMLGVLVDVSPLPRALAFEPDGVVGHASWLRVGAFVGLGVQFQ